MRERMDGSVSIRVRWKRNSATGREGRPDDDEDEEGDELVDVTDASQELLIAGSADDGHGETDGWSAGDSGGEQDTADEGTPVGVMGAVGIT
mmetsp:Transcript_42603/g.78771  ORF Transcript_42603/g.78771 Transcript_42603/m.78771 type:complete len:92 (+) Transcript_42603:44-319(+)